MLSRLLPSRCSPHCAKKERDNVNGDIIALLLGSSVLGAAFGAYLQSGRQREERFRERMIEAALRLLAEATAVERKLLDIQNARAWGNGADADADAVVDPLNEAWSSIPLLLIVFPDERVAAAARELLTALGVWHRKLRETDEALPRELLDGLHDDVGEAREGYASVTRRSIRRAAFRPLVLRRHD